MDQTTFPNNISAMDRVLYRQTNKSEAVLCLVLKAEKTPFGGSLVLRNLKNYSVLYEDVPLIESVNLSMGLSPAPMPGVDKCFSYMKTFTHNVALGKWKFVAICGATGLGKSHEILSMCNGLGLVRELNYFHVQSKIAPIELFKLAFRAGKGLIILDDLSKESMDAITPALMNLTETRGERYMTWKTNSAFLEDCPREFLAECSVCLLSNWTVNQFNPALIGRAKHINMDFSPEEKFHRVKHSANSVANSLGGVTQDDIKVVLRLMQKNLFIIKSVSLRCFKQALEIWRDERDTEMVTFQMCSFAE